MLARAQSFCLLAQMNTPLLMVYVTAWVAEKLRRFSQDCCRLVSRVVGGRRKHCGVATLRLAQTCSPKRKRSPGETPQAEHEDDNENESCQQNQIRCIHEWNTGANHNCTGEGLRFSCKLKPKQPTSWLKQVTTTLSSTHHYSFSVKQTLKQSREKGALKGVVALSHNCT